MPFSTSTLTRFDPVGDRVVSYVGPSLFARIRRSLPPSWRWTLDQDVVRWAGHWLRSNHRSATLAAVAMIFLSHLPLQAQCEVEGAAPRADVVLAAAACDRVVERFRSLYGSAPPLGTIELSDTALFFAVGSSGIRWRMIWPVSSRLRDFLGSSAPLDGSVDQAIDTQWSAVLPHELGHVLLDAEAASRDRGAADSGRIPDWLHEGTAIWMEPPTYRDSELAILKALRPYVPRLEDLLSHIIEHTSDAGAGGSVIVQTFYPCASEEACGGRPHWSRIFQVTTRQFPDGRVQVDTTLLAVAPRQPSPLAANAYAYSAALVRYLVSTGGSRAVSLALDRHLAGIGGPDLLVGLPGLPQSRSALETDWQRWFERSIFNP